MNNNNANDNVTNRRNKQSDKNSLNPLDATLLLAKERKYRNTGTVVPCLPSWSEKEENETNRLLNEIHADPLARTPVILTDEEMNKLKHKNLHRNNNKVTTSSNNNIKNCNPRKKNSSPKMKELQRDHDNFQTLSRFDVDNMTTSTSSICSKKKSKTGLCSTDIRRGYGKVQPWLLLELQELLGQLKKDCMIQLPNGIPNSTTSSCTKTCTTGSINNGTGRINSCTTKNKSTGTTGSQLVAKKRNFESYHSSTSNTITTNAMIDATCANKKRKDMVGITGTSCTCTVNDLNTRKVRTLYECVLTRCR